MSSFSLYVSLRMDIDALFGKKNIPASDANNLSVLDI